MTTKKSYECNVCRSPIRLDTIGVGVNGRGFAFGHGRMDWLTIQRAENHICDSCVEMLITSFRDSGIIEQFPPKSARSSGEREP